jgi:hypothetical protein
VFELDDMLLHCFPPKLVLVLGCALT